MILQLGPVHTSMASHASHFELLPLAFDKSVTPTVMFVPLCKLGP